MFRACVNAPMMQINEDYYEDLNETNTIKIIDSIIKNKPLKPGSYRGRKHFTRKTKKFNSRGKECLNNLIKYLLIYIMILDGK